MFSSSLGSNIVFLLLLYDDDIQMTIVSFVIIFLSRPLCRMTEDEDNITSLSYLTNKRHLNCTHTKSRKFLLISSATASSSYIQSFVIRPPSISYYTSFITPLIPQTHVLLTFLATDLHCIIREKRKVTPSIHHHCHHHRRRGRRNKCSCLGMFVAHPERPPSDVTPPLAWQ